MNGIRSRTMLQTIVDMSFDCKLPTTTGERFDTNSPGRHLDSWISMDHWFRAISIYFWYCNVFRPLTIQKWHFQCWKSDKRDEPLSREPNYTSSFSPTSMLWSIWQTWWQHYYVAGSHRLGAKSKIALHLKITWSSLRRPNYPIHISLHPAWVGNSVFVFVSEYAHTMQFTK